MKFDIKEIAACRKELLIEVPEAAVKEKTDSIYKDLLKTVKIPGFRPGKVPRKLVESRYSKDVREEVIQTLVSESFREGIKEHNISPIHYPEISEVSLEDNGPLKYKAVFDVSPVFELKNYTGIKVTKQRREVAADEIEKALQALQEQYAQYITVEEPHAVQKEDFVLCDYTYTVNGSKTQKKENVWLSPMAEGLNKSINEKTLGMNKDQTREFELVLPEDLPEKEFAGKKGLFSLKVKELKQKKLLPLDDEFAKDLGLKDLAELKKSIEANFKSRADREAMELVGQQIRKALIEDHPMDVPKSLVQSRLEELLRRMTHRRQSDGIGEAPGQKEQDDLRKTMAPHAEALVKEEFILMKIAESEDIRVSSDEVKSQLEGIARYSKKKVSELEKNKNVLYNIEQDLLLAKTMDFLVSKAEIEEKPAQND